MSDYSSTVASRKSFEDGPAPGRRRGGGGEKWPLLFFVLARNHQNPTSDSHAQHNTDKTWILIGIRNGRLLVKNTNVSHRIN